VRTPGPISRSAEIESPDPDAEGDACVCRAVQGLHECHEKTIASPALGVGPIYFNADVFPDPGQTTTSVDGGVTWLNMPLNRTYYVTAQKEGVSYPTVKFKINEADLAYGVELYIASPPDSVTGDNSSAPGQRGLPMLK